ncbi:MAG: hypothetical protein HKN20_01940 [Gemmatimonadetes bacterium]|nr:hypothetical protein [Gemmatimonadota bacterium]
MNQGPLSFDPATLVVTRGDTVQWNWSIGIHTVTSGTGFADPNVGALFDAPLDSANEFSYVFFDTVGAYPYHCIPHQLDGMTGTIVVTGDTTDVTQIGLLFSPANVNIRQGDTVRWTWNDGPHTVTSGTGFADPNVGALFDAPLDSANITFLYTFTDTLGTYPYHCIPHQLEGMNGTVTVEANPFTGVAGPDFPVDPLEKESTWSDLKALFR